MTIILETVPQVVARGRAPVHTSVIMLASLLAWCTGRPLKEASSPRKAVASAASSASSATSHVPGRAPASSQTDATTSRGTANAGHVFKPGKPPPHPLVNVPEVLDLLGVRRDVDGRHVPGCRVEDVARRAMTAKHMALMSRVIEHLCAREGQLWWSVGKGADGVERWVQVSLQVREVNLYHFNSTVTVAVTAEFQCSFFELVADGPVDPEWYMSHTWGEPWCHTTACLARHRRDRKYGEDKGIWICATANNQHELATAVTSDPTKSAFYPAMTGAARGAVTVIGESGMLFSRVWCAFEAHEAIALGGERPYLYDALTPLATTAGGIEVVRIYDGLLENELTFQKSGAEEKFSLKVVRAALDSSIKDCASAVPKDKEGIIAHVEGGKGTRELDATVRSRFLVGAIRALWKDKGALRQAEKTLAVMPEASLSVISIDADNNAPTGWVGAKLVPHLPQTGTLVNLTLVSCGLHDSGAQALARFLKTKGALNLRVLRLSSNKIGNAGATAIGKYLESEQASQLERLDLDDNEIGDVGATAIGSGLQFNGALKLKSLDLSRNEIGDVGATAIGKALEVNGALKLEILNLRNNKIGDVGATAIAKGLEFNGALNVTTYLSSNPISQSTKSEFQSDNRLRF